MQGCCFFLTSAFNFILLNRIFLDITDIFVRSLSHKSQLFSPVQYKTSITPTLFSQLRINQWLRVDHWPKGACSGGRETCYYIALPTFLHPLVCWAGEEGDEKRRGRQKWRFGHMCKLLRWPCGRESQFIVTLAGDLSLTHTLPIFLWTFE